MFFGIGNGHHGRPVRIGINAHLLSGEFGYRRAGIHNYIAQILSHLPPDPENFAYSIFTRDTTAIHEKPGFKIYRSHWPTERRMVRILWEQTAWPFTASWQNLDLIHSMAFVTPLFTAKPTVVTIYDLSFVHFPERFPQLQHFYLQSQAARSCKNARRVITISESGRQDVHRYFDIPRERIDVVVPGVDPHFKRLPAELVDEFRVQKDLPRQVILHVGTLQPRKNIPLLLEAVSLLNARNFVLVLAGGKGWFYDEIFARVVQLGLQDKVQFTGYVPDAELPLWYNAANLLVFPSLYEGFGLPVIEAMACGTPVIAAKSSSIPEAGGTAALYFNPNDVDELAKSINAVLEDAKLAQDLQEKAQVHVQQFSWERAGRETAQVYRKALRLI